MAVDQLTDLFDATARLLTPPGEKPQFKDAEVWQFIKLANKRVQALLRARNVMELRTTVDMTLLAGDTTLDGRGLGDFGFITKPLRLWEKPASETSGWTLMRYAHPLPMNMTSGEYLVYWDWLLEDRAKITIRFAVACTRNMTIRVEGPASLHISNTTPHADFYFANTVEPISLLAACFAAQARGDTDLASALERQGMEFVDGLIQEDVHLRQNRPVRLKRARSGFSTWRRW